MKITILAGCAFACVLGLGSHPANAAIIDLTIHGSDAIFLAGRTDLAIPAANLPWPGPATHLIRHGGATPEEILETLPPIVLVSAGDHVQVVNPATGGVNFFNGFGPPTFGPNGNGSGGSVLSALDGISGYMGPQGALVGVFLDAAIPSGNAPPATLDFTPGGLGTNFNSLAPQLGQVFYIGDGVTTANLIQTFIAPSGATRLALGIPDGFGFLGDPGAYDDNDGAYRVRIGVNARNLPEPGGLALMLGGLMLLVRRSARR